MERVLYLKECIVYIMYINISSKYIFDVSTKD